VGTSGQVPRVALLAPMVSELRPLLRKLSLERTRLGDVDAHSGISGGIEVVATKTGMGMAAATRATEGLLDSTTVDHVVVVGIAGGVGPTIEIGDLVVPEVVVDGRDGKEYRPAPLGEKTPRGRIVSSDQFGYEPDVTARFAAEGVVALDMETGAVAAVCERRGVPWSTFRAISDRGDDHTVDPAVLGLANQDGTANGGAVVRYLLRRPWRIFRLAKLGKDAGVAADRAASAALDACAQHERTHWGAS